MPHTVFTVYGGTMLDDNLLMKENRILREKLERLHCDYIEERKRNNELARCMQEIAPVELEPIIDDQFRFSRMFRLRSPLHHKGTYYMAMTTVAESLVMQGGMDIVDEVKQDLYRQYWTGLLRKAAEILDTEAIR